MRSILASVFLAFIVSSSLAEVITVKEFKKESYLGRWYQTFASRTVIDTFEIGAACVTADYGATSSPNKVTVLNSNTDNKDHGGKLKQIAGSATQSNPSEPGKLGVNLSGVPITVPYYIAALGPIVDGEYQWAIVTAPLKSNLFVLARNVDNFKSVYESEVLSLLKSQGFTHFYNEPLPTYHGSDCNYAPIATNQVTSFSLSSSAEISVPTSPIDYSIVSVALVVMVALAGVFILILGPSRANANKVDSKMAPQVISSVGVSFVEPLLNSSV